MPSVPTDVETAEEYLRDRSGPKRLLRRSFVTGLAILLPLLVTLLVLTFVLSFAVDQLGPAVGLVVDSTVFKSELVVGALTVVGFVGVVIAVGAAAEYGVGGGRLSGGFHAFMESIPAIGSVYTSFNEMSDLLLDSDTDSFQEVKLVEYPTEGSYVVAFKTAETPRAIADATDAEDLVTLFMPLAPNPVMGGFVVHVDRDRVRDVDVTVEEGVRSIVTSGVAIGRDDGSVEGLSRAQLRELATATEPRVGTPGVAGAGAVVPATDGDATTDDRRPGIETDDGDR